jgi:CRP-like cAMP-binding protein
MPCSRENSLIEAPNLCLAKMSARCFGGVVAGRAKNLALLLCPGQPGLSTRHQQIRSSSVTAACIVSVIFPTAGAFLCIVYMEDGSGVEVGTVGNEGFTNIEMLLDATIAIETVVCQVSGASLRMSADDFRTVIPDARALNKILKCSGQAYLAQVSQSVACNRLHSTDIRFARWLLITHDRVQGDEFEITQEFLAAMLGVHRPSVSVVAGLFQQAGIIRYTRGRMKILDRAKLEESACECYATVRGQFERLLGVPRG